MENKSRSVKSSSRTQLASTAYHEAAHAVARHCLGIKIKKVTIVPHDDCLGSVSGPSATGKHQLDVDNSNQARLKAERDVMVSLAGGIAQRKFSPKNFRHDHCSQDLHQAMDILSYFAGSHDELNAYHSYLSKRTENLLSKPMVWTMIQAVAKELLFRQTLTGAQVKEIIFNAFPDLKAFSDRSKVSAKSKTLTKRGFKSNI